jgi:hypothetical protein
MQDLLFVYFTSLIIFCTLKVKLHLNRWLSKQFCGQFVNLMSFLIIIY